eukprot:CAMPEP_0202480222 /NCGR_PEP_ID=MMETSP1361-20130828/298_1 /ASSEMBLY_ACC=CAM_ASM_000849 /TAXON_ID=210615 /ORGANISM="Staurosira complex sp., Strain CCMP2646" /LENGTH=122 /DNA_ID=CAMNT_0049107641 /DNA_START=146 /DNA_END=514 /DNA_ORIENTATION=+
MASTSTPSPAAKAKTNNSSPGRVKEEDSSTHALRRLWLRYGQATHNAGRIAEKAVTAKGDEQANKDLGEAVVGVLKSNIDLRRAITHVEGKITGQAKETEALEGCMRSQPCVGRKRKRNGKA